VIRKKSSIYLILLLLTCCTKNPSDSAQYGIKTDTEAASPIVHLLLEREGGYKGWFREISSPGNNLQLEEALYPWPLAVRISDIAGTDEGTAVCVNGKGAALFGMSGGGDDIFYFTAEIFAYKTTGNIIKKENSILCHIYKNTFFTGDYLSDDYGPFVEIDLKGNTVKKYAPGNLTVHSSFPSGYSLTELNLKGKEWYSAWKQSSKTKTMFRYFTHTTPEGENIREINEQIFKSSIMELNESTAPDLLKNSIVQLLEKMGGTNKIIDLTLRGPDMPAPLEYSAGNLNGNREKYEKINAAAGEGQYFFTYGKRIYTVENNKIFMLEVDKLPQDYYYTALYWQNGKLYAAWEQQQFYLTGKAGLSIINEKKVDKITQ